MVQVELLEEMVQVEVGIVIAPDAVMVDLVALQEEVVPPFDPVQLQVKVEVLVVIDDAVPVVQRLVVGVVVKDWVLEDPQVPEIAVGVTGQEASVQDSVGSGLVPVQ